MKNLLILIALLLPVTAYARTVISGEDLALRWPELLGEMVTVRATPVRGLAPAKYLVKVDKQDVVMLIAPGKVWSGKQVVCADVLGSEVLLDKGRTVVPSLMLTTCD